MANSKAGTPGDGSGKDVKRAAGGAAGAGKPAPTAESRPAKKGAASASPGGAAKSAAKSPAKGAAKSTAKSASKGAAKTPAKTPAKGAAKSAGKGRGADGAARAGKPDLRGDLRRFVDENPDGWGHDQWQGLLGRLGEQGHDTSDPDRIGMELERERLHSRLQGIQGVGAQRARSIVERFGTLYSLRHADADEIARHAKVSRDEAERIKNQLR